MAHSTRLPILIIGAGTSGLTLGLCLRKKGIPAIVLEQAAALRFHNYGINLQRSYYGRLLEYLGIEDDQFRHLLAVDSAMSSGGAKFGIKASERVDAFRCHSGKLHTLLSERTESIRWDHKVSKIDKSEPSKLIIDSQTGSKVEARSIIACDGPLSTTRQLNAPSMTPVVQPYVVYRGSRRISKEDITDIKDKYFKDSLTISHRQGGARFELIMENYDAEHADLSYIYSRKAKSNNDSLHRPNRSSSEAKQTPEALFEELEEVTRDLPEPFNKIFDADKIRGDRVLHWLMRTVKPDSENLQDQASRGLVLIGDAAHATPILGGSGANLAIEDAIDLAEYIATNGTETLDNFVAMRLQKWKNSVVESEMNLQEMHSLS